MNKKPKITFNRFNEFFNHSKADEIFITVTDKNHSDLPILTATQDKGMIFRDDFKSDIQFDKVQTDRYKRVKPNDFVIHLRSFQGGFAYSNIEGITSPAYTVIRFKNVNNHSPFYWKYLFSSENFIRRLDAITFGIRDGKSIKFSDFKFLTLHYPSKTEQEKIGNLFKKIDDLIEIQETKISKMEDFKKSMLQKMFPKKDELVPEFRFDGFDGDWEIDKLKNILNYRRGSFPQPYTEDSWYGGENSMPFVQVNGVATNSFKLKETTKNTITTIAMPKSVFVEKGTILVTIQGSIGRIALTQYDSYVDRTLLIITDNIIEFDKYFLINVLYLLFYKEKFKASGGTIKSITTKKLGNFKISFPSIEEQEKIGNFFKNLDSKIGAEEKLLDSYKMMKKSLLQKMFV